MTPSYALLETAINRDKALASPAAMRGLVDLPPECAVQDRDSQRTGHAGCTATPQRTRTAVSHRNAQNLPNEKTAGKSVTYEIFSIG